MVNLVSILAAAALVSMQYGFVSTQLINNEMDNNLSPIVAEPPSPRRRLRREFISISSPPPVTAQHVAGSALELHCTAMGHPAPMVHWERNGEPVQDFGLESNELIPIHPSSVASVQSVLIITTTSENPEDLYTCVATSGLKTKTASTTVFYANDEDEITEVLLQKLAPISNAPRIVTSMISLMQNMGTTAILPCQVLSSTKAQVYWESETGPILGNPRMRVLPSGDLMISSLRFSDMSDYICTVRNAFGSESIKTFLYPMLPSKR